VYLQVVKLLVVISAFYLDPLEPLKGQKLHVQAIQKLAKEVKDLNLEADSSIVSSMFDPNMVSAIPNAVNKKQFTVQSAFRGKQFFE
jgi:hypothetical protein